MTIIISTSFIVTILSYLFYKNIHKYRYYIYAVFGIIALLLLDEPNIVSLGYILFGIFLVIMYAGVLEKSIKERRVSEKMIPIPFGQLIKWMIREYKTRNSVFGVGSEKFFHLLRL